MTITLERPTAAGLDLLFARHTAAMHAETPPESIHMMDAGKLDHHDIRFFVLREGGEAVGMGAIKRIDADHGEVKSMHILAEWRGRGLARRMLDHLIADARAQGFTRLSLETGAQPGFAPARALYAQSGFQVCGQFEGYEVDVNSLFMTLNL